MIKILLVVPCKNYIDIAFKTFDEHCAADDFNTKEQYILEEVVINNEKVCRVNFDADVIISRGLIAEIIKKTQTNIPVIEIPLAGIDLLNLLHKCKKTFQCRKVGIIAAKNMLCGAEDLSHMISLSIKAYTLRNIQERHQLVDKACADGCDVILGGFNTCSYADRLGIKNMVIKTGREIFWQCITEAKRAAQISRREQEKSERFKTVLDYSHEGIISYDAAKYITTVNKITEKILKPSQPILPGQKIQSSSIPQDFKHHLMCDKEYINEIIKVNDIMITFNKANIIVKDSIVGSVVTFQEIKGIQDLESRIRKQIYSRGHVAKFHFEDIVGESSILRECISTAKRYGKTPSNILLVGDSGTGKEIFAQSIHNYSLRKTGPFVAVNCAALPESLLESELFGYADGAFTGAVKGGKPGFFELAHNGTIFLDEIGEIPIKLQAKLLRVIQEREVVRLGDSKVIPINTRLISATNKNLEELVGAGVFREDLFFRLNVLCMTLPPLRERRQDIPLLAEYFFRLNYPHIELADSVKPVLMAYEWPGNIRQLFNICERLTVLCDSNLITEKNIRHVFDLQDNRRKTDFSNMQPIQANDDEKERILKALCCSKYNRKVTAELLGIDRSTLWRKMREYKL